MERQPVSRGGGLGMDIYHVFTLLMVLIGNMWIYLNNTSGRAEDDPGTARSKQTTSKRNRVKSNDCNKKPRK